MIDRVYPLADAAEAHRRMEAGEHVGKIVLTVAAEAARLAKQRAQAQGSGANSGASHSTKDAIKARRAEPPLHTAQ